MAPLGSAHVVVFTFSMHMLVGTASGQVPPEVQSALDAHNARAAADSARDAATIAKQVAAQSVKAVETANAALKHAHDVIHGARVESKGLSPEQQGSLKKAEARLRATMSTMPPTAASSRIGDSSVASQEQVLNSRIGRLQEKLSAANATAADGELSSMQEELRQLRAQLAEASGEGGADKSVEQMDKELMELEAMLAALEEAEAKAPTASGHDALKVEIEHLKAAIGRLERYGSISATLPEKVKEPPQSGELRYKIAYKEEKPKVQLTPLSDIELSSRRASAHAVAKAKAAGRGTAPGIDVDTEMPYGELEPFGREDTAQELTEASIHESDQMVDQLEKAEVAEEKRAVFRALTRLRGAAITSFDGVARSQTGNIDEYNKVHKWRSTHPLRHLADEESDVSKWAFPDNADF